MLELLETIKELHKQTDWPFDGLDVGITLTKMSKEQLADLQAMIDLFEDEKLDKSYILGQIHHDLSGLKAEFIDGPDCFVPHSSGYAAKVS